MSRTFRDLAHTRASDKSGISCISVITLRPEYAGEFALPEQHVTAGRVRTHFAELVCDEVGRYVLPQLGALNFVLHGILAGGVTRSLALDAHDRSLSDVLLMLEIPG